MGSTISMLYSGAVEATAGTVVSSVFSTVTNTSERLEGLDVTLFSLRQELNKIQCAINAARRRRISDPQLLKWLTDLIHAVYLANYYYRIFNTRNSHPPMIASEGTSNLAISPFYREAKRRCTIKTFLCGDKEQKELDYALRMLRSIDTCAFLLTVNACPEWPIKTYLYMDPNRLFGRDKERDQVIKFLFEPSMAGDNNVDFLPIVGPREVGKTSLALHCCYDPMVQNHFSVRIHSNFSYIDYNIYEKILNQCNNTKITHRDENTVIAMLKQKLSSERFLLVIDKVLHVNFKIWNNLLDCLKCGKKGSKVILIFHPYDFNEYKKFIVPRTVKPVIVDGFSEEEYILFFKEHAFGSTDPEDYPELEKIGRDIATEMNGSIWGAKIFGELLRDNLNAEFWSNFLQGLLKKKFPLKHDPLRCDLDAVVHVISQILPKRLPVKSGVSVCLKSTSDEVKSYRELMVLGPNHCAPVNNNGCNHLEFLLTKHIFLNECTVITGVLQLD